MTAPTALPREIALDHYHDRLSLISAAGQAATRMWAEVDPDRIADSWAMLLPELTAVVSGAQLGAARQADGYVAGVLAAQGLDDAADSTLLPSALAGTASDGRGLMTLLANPVVVTLLSIQDGVDVARALGAGRANLDMLVRTQVADAGRVADQVAQAVRPAATGYVRVAVGGSCARCLLLAGKTYAWNQGFQRHPRCDCVHLPTAVARAGRLVQNPRQIYDRMSSAERVRAGFSESDQAAIKAGADLGQVINARRGVYTAGGRRYTREASTRRGLAGKRLGAARGRRAARLTPDQIFADAADRDDAVRLLHKHGYITAPVPAALAREARPAVTGAGSVSSGERTSLAVRPVLEQARNITGVRLAFLDEFERITRRRLRADAVDFGGLVATAREHAEGLLRGIELFPDATFRGVEILTGDRAVGRYAEAQFGRARFSEWWSAPGRRQRYVEALERGVASGWSPQGTANPMCVAIHEFGHILDSNTLGGVIHPDIDELLKRRASDEILSAEDYLAGRSRVDVLIRDEVSEYGRKSRGELVAEAFLDVVINGDRAGQLSREIFDLLETEYRNGDWRALT